MKKLMFMGILAGICLFTACKKDKKDAPASGFTAQVDGQTYTAINVMVTRTPPNPDVNPHLMLMISATDKNANILTVGITFPDDQLHTGTFEVNDDNTIIFGNTGDIYSSMTSGQAAGSIVISKITDHVIQGTFSGVVANANDASNTKTITSGHFNVKY